MSKRNPINMHRPLSSSHWLLASLACHLIEKRWTRRNVAALIVVDVTRLCDVHTASFTCNGGVPVDFNEHEHSLPLQGWSGEIYILFSISNNRRRTFIISKTSRHAYQINSIYQPTNQPTTTTTSTRQNMPSFTKTPYVPPT